MAEFQRLVASFETDTSKALRPVRELDAAYSRLELNLQRARGLSKLKTDSDRAGQSGQKMSRDVRSLSSSTNRFDQDADKASRSVRKLSTEMKDAERSSSGLMNSMRGGLSSGGGLFSGGGMIGNISQILGAVPGIGMLVGGAMKLVEPMKDAVVMGIEFNDQIERAQIGFTTLIGSEKQAVQHIKDLKDFAVRTPFEFTGLIAASQRLQAFGVAAKDVLPTMKGLGDRLAATGDISADALDRAIRSMGEIQSRGRVTGEQVREMSRLGINIPGIFAKALGMTQKEIAKLIEEGRIAGPNVLKVLTEGMEREAPDMMQKLMGTWSGQVSNLMDITKQRAGQGTKSLFEELKLRIKDLNSLLTSSIGEGLATGINVGTSKVLSVVDALVNAVKLQLGIQSPSTVFLEIGRSSGEGFVIGFQQALNGEASIKKTLDQIIVEAATRENLPEALIRAVIQQESGGKRKAVSHKGARGLMQLMPGTARRFGVTNVFDPEQNITAGARYLRQLLDMFGGNLDLALAGYNAGEGAVMKYGNQIPPYKETQEYVRSIKARLAGSTQIAQSAQPTVGGFPSLPDFIRDQAVLDLGPARVQQLLTETDRAQLQELSLVSKATMERLAAVERGIRTAEQELRRTRPDATGRSYSMQAEYAAAFKLDRLKDQSDRLRATLSAVNREWREILMSTVSLRLEQERARQSSTSGAFSLPDLPGLLLARSVPMPEALDWDKVLSIAQLLPEIDYGAKTVADSFDQAVNALSDFGLGLPPVMAGVANVGETSKKAAAYTKQQIEENRRLVLGTSNVLQTTLAEGFQGGLLAGLNEFEGDFNDMLRRMLQSWATFLVQMANQWATSKLTSLLFGQLGSEGQRGGGGLFSKVLGSLITGVAGPLGGAGSGAIGGIGSGFAGAFASGGTIPMGKWGIVHDGEQVHVGPAGAHVIPTGKRESGGTTIYNINVPVRSAGAYSSPRSRRQLAEDVAGAIQGATI